MCTKDRRIDSRSVCLTKPNQNSHKKFLRKSSPTNLECKPPGYNDRNVCKTIRQGIYVLFYNMNCSKCSTCESGRVPSCKYFYFDISKRILYFPYYFHVPCTVLFTLYLHTAVSTFRFLCY